MSSLHARSDTLDLQSAPSRGARLSRNYLDELLRSGKGLTGAVLVTLVVLVAIFAPLLSPHDITTQSVQSTLTYRPSGDHAGRDGHRPSR